MIHIKLEVICPKTNPIKMPGIILDSIDPHKKHNDFIFTMPKIRKLVLTEETEEKLWGEVKPWRNYCMPPLPWRHDGYREAIGYLDEEQAEIYNQRMKDRYKDKLKDEHTINSGIIQVIQKESSWDIQIINQPSP